MKQHKQQWMCINSLRRHLFPAIHFTELDLSFYQALDRIIHKWQIPS